MPRPISEWTVDYGAGPRPCTVPHAWRQDVDVRWEGPAVYRTTLEVPSKGGWLVFWGVSYAARVRIAPSSFFEHGEENEEGVGGGDERSGSPSPAPSPFSLRKSEGGAFVHLGIWDAFKIPLGKFAGQAVQIEVEVVKNGGPTYPVRDVASGFLPFVFNTFGGIWQSVELWDQEPDLEPPAPPCRVKVEGTKIFVDGKPFYLRGVLTWGWYPELGNHPCPDDAMIRNEVRLMKEMGFNTCKFCLWVPPHRYFEILEEEGMFAWMELPLWDPTPEPERQEAMFEELRRITLQYRRHSNILVWTCGCELSSNTSADFRRRLYEMVKELTGAALVKDNSGSSEMYGGDLREYGDFYDFHPYCDLPFYPVVLDSLLIGPREKKPILLGEFNDIDVHRDLPRIKREKPFWASSDPALADQGVRWTPPELPRILEIERWTAPEEEDLMATHSLTKASFIREQVQQAVRSREDLAGYVVTGWRDTPISIAGLIDDWGQSRDGRIAIWNAAAVQFAIPFRRPPWVHGGNRPGWIDPWNHFEGQVHLRLGLHTETELEGTLWWQLESIRGLPRPEMAVVAEGHGPRISIPANERAVVADLYFDNLSAGIYYLTTRFEAGSMSGNLVRVVPKPRFASMENWRLEDSAGLFFGMSLPGGPNVVATSIPASPFKSAVAILINRATSPMPFWRESSFDWPRGRDADLAGPDWSVLASVSGDRVLDLEALQTLLPAMTDVEVLINRVDHRTYTEAPILLRAKVGKGTLVATTLRPFGGLGCQPIGVMNNPAGADLLVKLMKLAEEG